MQRRSTMHTIPDELITLSHPLGDPRRQYVIIGEGNTSLRVDEQSFLVKASGQQLATITAAGFAHVQFDRIMHLFDTPPQTLTEERDLLRAARMDESSAFPSVETSFHAMLLERLRRQLHRPHPPDRHQPPDVQPTCPDLRPASQLPRRGRALRTRIGLCPLRRSGLAAGAGDQSSRARSTSTSTAKPPK